MRSSGRGIRGPHGSSRAGAGVVLDANGSELCAGAEGIVGSDAPFWVQVLEAGKDIDDELIAHVLTTERREDVPGAPLNWQVAADQLIWNLLHRCSQESAREA